MQKQIFFSFVLVMMLVGKVKAQHNNPFGNALIPDMIADASIQEINGVFYCYATTDGYGQGLKTSGPPVVWKSKDFVHWSFDGTYFPSAAKEKYWAPSKAIFANGKYYIYPTINGYMYPAVADKPEGPFKLARGKTNSISLLLLLLYCRVRIRAGLMLKSLLTTMGRLMCFGDEGM